MEDPIPTSAEFALVREIVEAVGAGDERRFQELRARLGWPFARLARTLKAIGAIEDPAPLPLP